MTTKKTLTHIMKGDIIMMTHTEYSEHLGNHLVLFEDNGEFAKTM
ncbi:Uncharacterized protein dnm_025680 [Desulfonema magnum]|uniref:Uncharacterized protein n=1 Tax=Desulfonema magnum TaxID=45655 RepID=A0A975BK51_9BACT|nr:Uncharacterized protein dnm_025680 [Desulfonema magnum]